MKKPGANYKMSKSAKINLAVNWDRPGRAARKRSVIHGELCAAEVVRNKKDKIRPDNVAPGSMA